MVWGKRRFAYADYSPYFDLMRKLRQADPTPYRQFIMISTERVGGESDYYVGVPNQSFMDAFDGFERVEELMLPKVIDALHIGDATSNEFTSSVRVQAQRTRRRIALLARRPDPGHRMGVSYEVGAMVVPGLVIGGIVGWYVRELGEPEVRASTNFTFMDTLADRQSPYLIAKGVGEEET